VNLLVNACEAGNGGRIRVSAELVRTNEGPAVRVVVADQGGGMDADALARVWEPFFTTKPSGTGLGLPIVKRVIDAHGGRIDITSQPLTGTTVTIELPARPDASPQH
jgi:signal transduction histidine kinase